MKFETGLTERLQFGSGVLRVLKFGGVIAFFQIYMYRLVHTASGLNIMH